MIKTAIKNGNILETAVFKNTSFCININKNGIIKINSIKLRLAHINIIKNAALEKSFGKGCFGKITIGNNAVAEIKSRVKKNTGRKVCVFNCFTLKINRC